mgnify:CR=1 FL=1
MELREKAAQLPLAPGVYAFELEVDNGTTTSAPVRIEIAVTSAEGVL